MMTDPSISQHPYQINETVERFFVEDESDRIAIPAHPLLIA